MFRLIITILFVFLFLVCSIPLMGIEWLVGKVNKKAADHSSLRLVQWAFRMVLELSGVHIQLIGEENIPRDEAVLYIGNHRSLFDAIIGYTLCPGLTCFIAKNNLEQVPLLRVWMRRLYCLFLNRDNLKDGLRVIQTAIEYIHQGISVFVFPEGTRTRTGEMGTFKEGTFKIASRTNCRIVPVAFSNTENIFEAHFPFITSTTVTVHFGEPIDVSRFDKEGKKHLGAYTQHVIADMLEQVSAN